MPGGAAIGHIGNVGVTSAVDGRNDFMLNARLPADDGTRTSATGELMTLLGRNDSTPNDGGTRTSATGELMTLLGRNDSTPNDNLRASPTGGAAVSRDATSAKCVSRCSP